MSENMIGNYRRWLEYEDDAHAKVLASFETVPDDRRGSPGFRRAVTLMAHVVIARRMWLARLGVIPTPTTGVSSFFPEDAEVAKVAADWDEVRRFWSEYLAGLDDEALDRELEYRALDGSRFRSRVGDIFAQLFGHSWYHRGQVAMLIRAAGGEPAITDLIYWSREAVPDAEG
jgi:uncharacterized damage-inducible protein DinB